MSSVAAQIRTGLRILRGRRTARVDVVADEEFGKALTKLAARSEFLNYVEIGTAHGLGSTKVTMEALLARNDESRLWTVEYKPYLHQMASKNWQGCARITLLQGAVDRAMMSWEEAKADPAFAGAPYNFEAWQKQKRQQAEAPLVLGELPEVMDVLLLDGGDFTSYGEFKALSARAKVLCLDDTRRLKNRRVRDELLGDEEWQVLADSEARSGWSVFCRRGIYESLKSVL